MTQIRFKGCVLSSPSESTPNNDLDIQFRIEIRFAFDNNPIIDKSQEKDWGRREAHSVSKDELAYFFSTRSQFSDEKFSIA